MGFDQLPFELVEQIVNALWDAEEEDHHHDLSSSNNNNNSNSSLEQQLCDLALVGQRFLLDLARARLYRALNFRHAWTKHRLELFQRTTKETDLGLLTRELHLGLDAPVDESELYEKDVMLHLIRALPNIQILRIGNGALKLAPALKRHPTALQNVHTLLIDYRIDAKPTRLRNFAANLPTLQDLTVKILASQKPPQAPAKFEPLARSLRRLTLIQDRGARPAPFDLLLRLFAHRQHTQIHAVHVCSYAILPPRYPSMRVFGLPPPHLITSFELFVHSAVPPFLADLCSLQAFTLVFVPKSGIIDPSVLDRIVADGLFPATIQSLQLRYQGYQSDLLPNLLEVKQCAKKLRHVTLDFRLGDKQAQKDMAKQLAAVGVQMDINYNVF